MRTNLPRRIDALDQMFSFLESPLLEHAVETTTANHMKLAAEELFTNFVRHNRGKGDQITFELEVTDQQILLRFIDHDVDPWDPASAPPADVDLPFEQRTPGGLGLHLVKSIVDHLSYDYRDRAMTVTAIKNRGA